MVSLQSVKVIKLDGFLNQDEEIHINITKFINSLSSKLLAEDWAVNFGVDSSSWNSLRDIDWSLRTSYQVITFASISRGISITIDLNFSKNYGGYVRFFSVYPENGIDEARLVIETMPSFFSLVYGFAHDGRAFDVSFDAVNGIDDGLRDVYYYNYFGKKITEIINNNLDFFRKLGASVKVYEDKCVAVDFSVCFSIKDFGKENRSQYANALGSDLFVPGGKVFGRKDYNGEGPASGRIGCLGLIKMLFFNTRKRRARAIKTIARSH